MTCGLRVKITLNWSLTMIVVKKGQRWQFTLLGERNLGRRLVVLKLGVFETLYN
jgi:hypothetical protein